jgi:cell fate (sporulation/competence/biofilm development) regulator YlbF (YheA/YmcA/DUF963 family)
MSTAIIELANRLGRAISESPATVALREARKAMDAEENVSQLLTDFREHSEKVESLARENKPIEVEDKHRLQELQQKLMASEAFKQFTAAQVEYVDLMRKVNQAIQSHIQEGQA